MHYGDRCLQQCISSTSEFSSYRYGRQPHYRSASDRVRRLVHRLRGLLLVKCAVWYVYSRQVLFLRVVLTLCQASTPCFSYWPCGPHSTKSLLPTLDFRSLRLLCMFSPWVSNRPVDSLFSYLILGTHYISRAVMFGQRRSLYYSGSEIYRDGFSIPIRFVSASVDSLYL